MKDAWSKLGGVLGIAYCVAGFFLIFLGWNGAASNDSEAAQLPYVISGGLAGLGLIVVGAALIVATSLRSDRVELQATIDGLRAAAGASSAPASAPATSAPANQGAGAVDEVVVGSDSYHRPACSLVQGQADQATMTRAEARQSGRSACRVCHPDDDR